ncbi:hypothetical protein V1520DRAFT_66095 [Lipomyces starkeyi]|uniref:Uncharacterized protein n=1 Tax=Lipomyces starkeyi NRRL Y-11557 TaxID=675824 RepID=A0A1E3PWR2_LIPST|nr:hypothetical protein LIPSTDRAFT_197626 [Lipomyces starkeyi NRRL Y-11557]
MTQWSWGTTGVEVVTAFGSKVKGSTVVITGPSAGGIGAETAITLASGSPSLIILTGRTESNIIPVISEIDTKYPSVLVKFIPLDLSSQASVRSAAAKINESVQKIDFLINNAAIMAAPYSKSVDGIESQFATNYIGHFLLTNLIIGKLLKAGPGARIVNVSSSAHRSGTIRFDDPGFSDGKFYNEWEAYAQSKSANILFSRALATKLEPHGCFAFSCHPGSIKSGLQVHLRANESILADGLARAAAAEKAAGREFIREPQKSLEQGCSTTLVALLDPSIEDQNGAYLVNGDIAGNPLPEYLTRKENENKLWLLSEELVGEKFDFWRN